MPIHRGIKQCSYVRHDGRRCGSPACGLNLGKDVDRCYHHDRQRYPDPAPPLTPELRELIDLVRTEDFYDYATYVAQQCADGTATLDLVQDLLSSMLGFDIRKHDDPLRAHSLLKEKEPSASSASSVSSVVGNNPRSSAFICG
jgi:hypothetical protein